MLTSIFVLIASIMVITFWLSSVYLIFFRKSDEEDVMFVYGINAIILMIIIACILIYVIA